MFYDRIHADKVGMTLPDVGTALTSLNKQNDLLFINLGNLFGCLDYGRWQSASRKGADPFGFARAGAGRDAWGVVPG